MLIALIRVLVLNTFSYEKLLNKECTMEDTKKYWVLAYYHIGTIENPEEEVANHKDFFANRDVTGRIYISPEGINGQMSGVEEDAQAYINWMHSRTPFENLEFKIHKHEENVFPRMTVKLKKQLVAMDRPVDFSKRGVSLSPQEWKEMLDRNEAILIDVRNNYETEVGHFKNAILPDLESFREFPKFAQDLKEKIDPKTSNIMMYCTGGIRCELYSAYMKEEGFENIYQLDGGVIKYGMEVGNDHWEGKLFVFDDRLTIPISEKEAAPIIAHCMHCNATSDAYYNCANMDCNHLYVSCRECLEKYQGCCSCECMSAPRLREYQKEGSHKPFRRMHLL